MKNIVYRPYNKILRDKYCISIPQDWFFSRHIIEYLNEIKTSNPNSYTMGLIELYYKIFKGDELDEHRKKLDETRKKLKEQAPEIIRQHTDDTLMIKYLPERIDTLPPREIMQLGELLNAYNLFSNAPDNEKTLSEIFYTSLSLYYSLDGWYINKIIAEFKKGNLKQEFKP